MGGGRKKNKEAAYNGHNAATPGIYFKCLLLEETGKKKTTTKHCSSIKTVELFIPFPKYKAMGKCSKVPQRFHWEDASLKTEKDMEFDVLFLVLRRFLPCLHQTLASFQLK